MNRNAVIVGGGRVGRHTAEQLVEYEFTVTVIERDTEKCATLANQRVGRVVEGSGTDIETLKRADATDADIVAALTDDVKANIRICGLARELAPGVRTLARIAEDGEQDYEHLSDIDGVVYPAAAGADAAVERLLGD